MQPFIYQLLYLVFSILGNYNYFFFAAHLLDVAVGVAALRIILEAITHNGKQLVLTVMLLTIVVYIYTVIAFNFFRKFYVSEEEEEVDPYAQVAASVKKNKKKDNRMVYAGYGAGAGVLVGLLGDGKLSLEKALIGGLLGFVIGSVEKPKQQPTEVKLDRGTLLGVRLNEQLALKPKN